jgi:hypothetical protein
MFPYYCENLRQIDKTITLLEVDIKRAIRRNDLIKEKSYTTIYQLLISNWIEVRLYKILNEPNGFTQSDIEFVLRERSLTNKWKKLVSIGFCKANSLPSNYSISDLENHLDPTHKQHFLYITDLIENDLDLKNTLRNRIAHGQFKYIFNSQLNAISNDLMTKFDSLNIVTLQQQKIMINTLALIVNSLIQSPVAFDRDFIELYEKLKSQKNNYHKRDYAKFRNQLINSEERGKAKRLNELS